MSNNMDMDRYKYLNFSEGSLCVISEGTMKFTAPSCFNEPFDCAPDFDRDKQVEYFMQQKEAIMNISDQHGQSPSQRLMYKKRLRKKVENEVKEGKYASVFLDELGVCSLSRTPLNLLMWAHYAKNHTGFVVEFSIPIPKNSGFSDYEVTKSINENLVPFPVQYEEEKPIIDPHDHEMVNMVKNFLTKGKDWEYENEERVIDYVRGKGIHPYNRKKILKSVIAGMRMSSDNYQSLKKIIDDVNNKLGIEVELFRASPVKRTYALEVTDRPDLNKK